MNATLEQDILAESYTDIEGLLGSLCWKFRRQYGGDLVELRAEANYQFIRAHNSFDPEAGKSYKNWVWFKVWKNLLERVRQAARNRARAIVTTGSETIEFVATARCDETRNVDLLDEFTGDAKAIVQLFMDIPNELEILVAKRGGTKTNVKSSIRDYMKRTCGWTKDRVKESFMEVELILNG